MEAASGIHNALRDPFQALIVLRFGSGAGGIHTRNGWNSSAKDCSHQDKVHSSVGRKAAGTRHTSLTHSFIHYNAIVFAKTLSICSSLLDESHQEKGAKGNMLSKAFTGMNH